MLNTERLASQPSVCVANEPIDACCALTCRLAGLINLKLLSREVLPASYKHAIHMNHHLSLCLCLCTASALGKIPVDKQESFSRQS